ncbi:LOW QUALITY PROTEIN: HMG-Y-related protein B-like [Sesamum indicum]|uniref:HMG-Y-related protein A n=1 Tax=Sesamum indicum TaxID=4182 RepID=A0A8M8V0J1_SESIN|nr:LOW QUALITY PROTEIN: HMG-Y-related protein B-like [Sesamum indicum]
MASEEVQANHFQPPAPAPAPPVPPGTLPQYPEMILAAIEALNEENGSNKSSISKHIEATYGNLPPAHSTLLTHHLNKMKSAGQLLFIKNNYLKPDPNAPPRRGRGRPPKPKSPLPPGTVSPPPRPRGRPPKSRDPTAPPPPPKPKATSTTGNVSGKKRGRPPKGAAEGAGAAPPPGGAPRGRGRPPKVKPAVAAPVGA